MTIVEKAARIISPEAFQRLWGPRTDLDKARQKYQQAEALYKAGRVLRLAAQTSNLSKVLTRLEVADWKKLGVPADAPEILPIVREKYAPPKEARS